MHLAVRIFIIVNLALCVALAVTTATAFAYRENWKVRWDEDTAKLKALNESNAQLAVDKGTEAAKAANDVRNRDTRITDLQAEVARLTNEIKDKSGEIARLSDEVAKKSTDFAALVEDFRTQSESLEKTRTRMTELNHIAQVSKATTFNLAIKLAEVEDDLNNAVSQNTQLQERLDTQDKTLKRNDAFIAFVRDNFHPVYDAASAEKTGAIPVDAVVALVKGEGTRQDIVVLSIGEAQVQPGTEFIVSRGSDYVAKVRVATVTKDMATCRVIPETWNAKNLAIAVGDTAMTGR
jgi:myosin heavy subunit